MSDDPKDLCPRIRRHPPPRFDHAGTRGCGLTRAGGPLGLLILGFLNLTRPAGSSSPRTRRPPLLTFLSWHWNLPLGVAIPLAAVAGGLITGMVSAARMFPAAPDGQEEPEDRAEPLISGAGGAAVPHVLDSVDARDRESSWRNGAGASPTRSRWGNDSGLAVPRISCRTTLITRRG